jgi:NDP-sugar pyrophosphorylase family protein
MQVLILAGGRGTRLSPLTDSCPKPLLYLGDRPILTHIVERIPRVHPVTVIIASQMEAPFQAWRAALPTARRAQIYVEPAGPGEPLGPVRALSACVDELGIDDDLLVLMGDSLLPFQLREFFEGASAETVRIAAHRVPRLELASRFGVIEMDPDDRVSRFTEKPEVPRSPWIFTGCAYIPRRLRTELPRGSRQGLKNSGDLIASFLQQGERIEVFRATGEWHDIGTLESYLQAHQSLLTEGRRRSLAAQGNLLGGSVYVHPSAQVADSTLRDCVVLAGARVLNAHLTSCVVEPHAAVRDRSLHRKLISVGNELSFGGE